MTGVPIQGVAHTERRYASPSMRTLSATVLLAVALTGCGGKSHNAANSYALAVSQTQFQFADEFDKATTQLLTSSNPATDAKALRAAAAAVTGDVRTMRQIDPPAAVRSLHQKLITLLDGYGATVRRAATLVASGHPGAFVKAKDLLTTSSAQIKNRFDSLITQINERLS
jgi:hypothetical protein